MSLNKNCKNYIIEWLIVLWMYTKYVQNYIKWLSFFFFFLKDRNSNLA